MGISGPVTLVVAIAGLVVVLVVAHRSRLLDAIQRRIEGRHPPEQSSEYGRGNLRIVRAPSPLPRRSPPCDLYGYRGGDDGAA